MPNVDPSPGVARPLDLSALEGAPTRYADYFSVQRIGDTGPFVLCVSEVKHPIIVGSPAEVRTALAARAHVAVDCIARVAIFPDKVADLVKLLQDALAKCGVNDVHSNAAD